LDTFLIKFVLKDFVLLSAKNIFYLCFSILLFDFVVSWMMWPSFSHLQLVNQLASSLSNLL